MSHDESGNFKYMDEKTGARVDESGLLDPTFNYSMDHKVCDNVTKYFSHAVNLTTVDWNVGTTSSGSVKPWSAFFDDLAIKNKLQNYAWLQCKLRIRVIVTASPFYYGRILFWYRHMPTWGAGNIFSTVTAANQLLTPLSQRPGFYIDVGEQTEYEIVLPFVFHRNYLDVIDKAEFENFGEFGWQSVVPLATSNGIAGTGVSFRVMCSAEAAMVSGLTFGTALQSNDEYKEKPVSKVASSIAYAAGLLTKAPLIGPLALATQQIASGIGTAASWLGFTNVPVIEDSMPMKNLPFHAFSSSEISKPIEKFSLDPKTELSISPATVGLDGHDEMSINNIISRSSHVDVVTWSSSSAVDTNIWVCTVTPDIKQFFYDGSKNIICGTPLSHVARMFKEWRGDIIYTFRIIASQYHKGCLRITWDPSVDIDSATDTITTNKNIDLDISTTREIEYRVRYDQARPFQLVRPQEVYAFGTTTAPKTRSFSHDNGVLTVKVFTELTSPNATADAYLQVSVRAAENFQFNNPISLETDNGFPTFYELQSEDMPCCNNYECIDETTPEIFKVNYGEAITSLRQLFHRTCKLRTQIYTAIASTTRAAHVSSRFHRFPMLFGYDPNGINSASNVAATSNVPFNYVRPIPLTHMAPCFLGRRGSINWSVNTDSPQGPVGSMSLDRNNMTSITVAGHNSSTLVNSTDDNDDYARVMIFDAYSSKAAAGESGMSLMNQHTQTGLEVNAQDYHGERMRNNNPAYTTLGWSKDGSNLDAVRLSFLMKPDASYALEKTTSDFYVSTGPDFSLLYFVNVPTLYNITVPTKL